MRELLDANAPLGVRRVIGEALAARLVRQRVVDEELAGRARSHRVVLVALSICVKVARPALLALARGEARLRVQVEQLANGTRTFCAITESDFIRLTKERVLLYLVSIACNTVRPGATGTKCRSAGSTAQIVTKKSLSLGLPSGLRSIMCRVYLFRQALGRLLVPIVDEPLAVLARP